MTNEDRKRLSEIGYQVIDAKNEHVENGWIVRVPNDDKRVLIAASEGDAWDAARDHHASMTNEVTQGDSGMEGQSVERAELVWANLPTNRPWASLPTYEKALVCHTLARLTAQSGEGRAAIIEECAAVADGWNPGRKDRVTETGIATAIRELSGDTREGISAPTQRMAETLGARFVISGEGRSGAGEDWAFIRECVETARSDYEGYHLSNKPGEPNLQQYDEALRWIDAALSARQSGEGERV